MEVLATRGRTCHEELQETMHHMWLRCIRRSGKSPVKMSTTLWNSPTPRLSPLKLASISLPDVLHLATPDILHSIATPIRPNFLYTTLRLKVGSHKYSIGFDHTLCGSMSFDKSGKCHTRIYNKCRSTCTVLLSIS